jgi:hypothetical protein
MQAHPPMAIDRDNSIANAEPVTGNVYGGAAEGIARNLKGQTWPKLAPGTHDERNTAHDAVEVWANIHEPMSQCDVV